MAVVPAQDMATPVFDFRVAVRRSEYFAVALDQRPLFASRVRPRPNQQQIISDLLTANSGRKSKRPFAQIFSGTTL